MSTSGKRVSLKARLVDRVNLTSNALTSAEKSEMRERLRRKFLSFLVILTVLDMADIVWLYYYVMAWAQPTPRTAINHNLTTIRAFGAAMMAFGFFLGVANMFTLIAILVMVGARRHVARSKGQHGAALLWLVFNLCFVFPLFILGTFGPFFGSYIFGGLVRDWYWAHSCDNYPMYAILDGPNWDNRVNGTQAVYFFDRPTHRLLYTYEIVNKTGGSQVYLRLSDWNAEQATIPLDEYPTLQSIGYDLTNSVLTGNCTIPGSTANSCVSGTFDKGSHLTFNITSTVPLNNTANIHSIAPTKSLLTIQDSTWLPKNFPLGLILHEVDTATDTLGPAVLRTTLIKPADCTELKVCLAGVPGRAGSQVGAEVMAPLGIMLMQQSWWSVDCTDPSHKPDLVEGWGE